MSVWVQFQMRIGFSNTKRQVETRNPCFQSSSNPPSPIRANQTRGARCMSMHPSRPPSGLFARKRVRGLEIVILRVLGAAPVCTPIRRTQLVGNEEVGIWRRRFGSRRCQRGLRCGRGHRGSPGRRRWGRVIDHFVPGGSEGHEDPDDDGGDIHVTKGLGPGREGERGGRARKRRRGRMGRCGG